MLAWPLQEEDMPLAVHFKDSSPQAFLDSTENRIYFYLHGDIMYDIA